MLSEPVVTTILQIKDGASAVEFYRDLPGLKTVDHVCVLGPEKAAWFEDPDGNVLCLHEIIS